MAEPSHDRRSILVRALALPVAFLVPSRRTAAADSGICELTESDFLGPMYRPGAPRRSVLAGPREPGERLRIRGTVLGPDCRTPVSRALLDVWQADAAGQYHDERESYRLRGQILTDARGRYQIDTIRPGGYGGRPAHIHFTVSAPGHESLTTQLYFRGDPVLDHDSCGPACNSGDPHRIVALSRVPSGFEGTFDLVLKGSPA
jgi:protocatechuate 3,4-dioxygenase beta subunit